MNDRTYEIVRHERGEFSVIVFDENVVKLMKRFASASEARSWIQVQKEGWDMNPSVLLERSRAARLHP
jgi:hypothetical protein